MVIIPLEQQKLDEERVLKPRVRVVLFRFARKKAISLHTGRISHALVLRRKGKEAMPDQLLLELVAFQSLREH